MVQQLRTILVLAFITALGFFCGVLAYGGLSGGHIPENTWVGEFYVGGRTRSETIDLLKWLDESMRLRTMSLTAESISLTISGEDLGMRVDMDEAHKLIDELIRSQSLFRRALNSLTATPQETNKQIPIVFSHSAMNGLCDRLASEIDRPPVNARYDILSRQLVSDEPGVFLDRAALGTAIIQNFQRSSPGVLKVPVRRVDAEVTLSMLHRLGITTCVSSYHTTFDSQDIPRSSNIRRAVELIDSTILMPLEEFSFNRRVGPRTRDRGFKEAKEIVDSEYVIGVGGGVCQVSSTLYNAAILAGFDVLERRPHSKVAAYVEAGRDATVYYPAIDLRFLNSLEGPAMVSSQVRGNTIYAAIVGSPAMVRRVEVTTRIVSTLAPETNHILDASLPQGTEITEQEPEAGLIVETYRKVYAKDGTLAFEGILSRDIYPPVNRVLRVGAGM